MAYSWEPGVSQLLWVVVEEENECGVRCYPYIIRPKAFVQCLKSLDPNHFHHTIEESFVIFPFAEIVQWLVIKSRQNDIRWCYGHSHHWAGNGRAHKNVQKAIRQTQIIALQIVLEWLECGQLSSTAQYSSWYIANNATIQSAKAANRVDLPKSVRQTLMVALKADRHIGGAVRLHMGFH